MKLSDKALRDFKKIYLKKFGVRLSDEEANEKGIELLEFYRLIYQPNPRKQ